MSLTPECAVCAALPTFLETGGMVGLRSGVDFRPTTPRPIVYGQRVDSRRCRTHRREDRAASKAKTHDATTARTFGVPRGWYEEQYERQGRKCWFPRCRATGKTKRLAVDHDRQKAITSGPDHPEAHDVDRACRYCVRGLLCGPHNYDLVGRYRVDLEDAVSYLADPPAQQWTWHPEDVAAG